MGVKLTEKKLVTAMNTDQTFLIVVDGAVLVIQDLTLPLHIQGR
jgi:hypothetical protein